MKILITTVGGLTSPDIILAYKEKGIEVVGVDPFEEAVGRFFVDRFFTVPFSGEDEEGFVNRINQLLKEEPNISAIIPCGNEDVLTVAKNRHRFSVPCMVSDYRALEKAFDKFWVYTFLTGISSSLAPKFFLVKNRDELVEKAHSLGYPDKPLWLKPPHGRGGRGVVFVKKIASFSTMIKEKNTNLTPLEALIEVLPEEFPSPLIIMENLTSPFYSFYALAEDGRIIVSLTHIREWGNASQTFRGSVYYDELLQEKIAPLIETLKLSFCINVELATDENGNIKVFDFNPRISASSGVDRKWGVNFPYLSLSLLLGKALDIDMDKVKEVKGRFYRYFDVIWQ